MTATSKTETVAAGDRRSSLKCTDGGASAAERRPKPTKASKGPRKIVEPPRESAIYDGSKLLGTIKPTGAGRVARGADGKRIGVFSNDRDAMRAICHAARFARLAEAS